MREIPDAELALVKLVVAHGEITFWNNAAYQTSGATTQAQPATQAGKAFQNVAIGAGGIVGGPASVALAVGVSALFNVFEAVANGNDDAFREARLSAVVDELRRVAGEVRKIQEARAAAGKPVDPPDPLTQGVLFSEFAEAVASAATLEKRTAVVHAAARQFDPEAGAPAVRKYWFDLARVLGDLDIVVIRLLRREHNATIVRFKVQGFGGNPSRRLTAPSTPPTSSNRGRATSAEAASCDTKR